VVRADSTDPDEDTTPHAPAADTRGGAR
jgi:hypothetical protein